MKRNYGYLFLFVFCVFFVFVPVASAQCPYGQHPAIEGGCHNGFNQSECPVCHPELESRHVAAYSALKAEAGKEAAAVSLLKDKPVFQAQQSSFTHLNWGWQLNMGYGYGSGLPTYPASSDYRVQSALGRMSPQSAWEAFALTFQDKAYVRNELNTIAGQGNYYANYLTPAATTVNYPIPKLSDKNAWFVVISVKPEQIQDGMSHGYSLSRSIISELIGLGGVYVLAKARNTEWTMVGIAALNASSDIAAYRHLQEATSMRFSVTVQFRNSETGVIRTYKATTRELFPIIQQDYVLYYDSARGLTKWIGWDQAIQEPMQSIRNQWLGDFARNYDPDRGLSQIERDVNTVNGKIKDMQAELANIQALTDLTKTVSELQDQLEAAKKKLAEAGKVKVEEPPPIKK